MILQTIEVRLHPLNWTWSWLHTNKFRRAVYVVEPLSQILIGTLYVLLLDDITYLGQTTFISVLLLQRRRIPVFVHELLTLCYDTRPPLLSLVWFASLKTLQVLLIYVSMLISIEIRVGHLCRTYSFVQLAPWFHVLWLFIQRLGNHVEIISWSWCLLIGDWADHGVAAWRFLLLIQWFWRSSAYKEWFCFGLFRVLVLLQTKIDIHFGPTDDGGHELTLSRICWFSRLFSLLEFLILSLVIWSHFSLNL